MKSSVFWNRSQDSSVGIATVLGLDGRCSISVGARNSSLLHSVQIGSEAHPASYKMGTGGCFPGKKRPGHETDYSRQPSVEVKNGGAIPPLPLRLHA
jgi:hypothetical protein